MKTCQPNHYGKIFDYLCQKKKYYYNEANINSEGVSGKRKNNNRFGGIFDSEARKS